jgi:hypothetical protein
MKKIILAALLSLSLCGGVMAADNGEILTREEAQVQTFMTAMNTANGYDAAKGSMSKALSAKMNARTFGELQKQVNAKFGTPKEIKLASLQKYDQGDRLTYVAAYSMNNQLVRITVIFGPNGRDGIQSFSFTPIQVPQKK